MTQAGTHWTEEHLQIAKKMYEDGADYEDIGDAIGRSGPAVYDMLRKRIGATRVPRNRHIGPPIGITMECARRRLDGQLGSEVLRTACLDLFQRTANRYQISMADAMACHLGFHAPAKLIRAAPHKTQSALRELAA